MTPIGKAYIVKICEIDIGQSENQVDSPVYGV